MHQADAATSSSPPTTVATPAPSLLPLGALALGNLCLAFGPWLVRLADVGPLASAFWRLALAAPVLMVGMAATRTRLPVLPRPLLIALSLGGLLFAADLAAWHQGILRTKLANATLFGNVTSFLFPVYGFLAARTLPSRMQGVALALAAAGVVLLMGRSFELSATHFVGDLLCLAAGLSYTGYIIVIGRARETLAPWPVLVLVTLAATIPALALALAARAPLLPHDWTPLVLLALGSQVAGQGLLVFAVGRLTPLVMGLGLLMQPVIAAAIGWIAYRETLGLPDLAGAALIAVALVLVRRG